MADEPTTKSPVADTNPDESATRPTETESTQDAPTADADASKQTEEKATSDDDVKATEDAGAAPATEAAAATAEKEIENGEAADPTAAVVRTPAARKIGGRKSGAGIPEHKGKKTPKSAKKAPELHLDAKPGSLWLAYLKGYQPWPAIVCDEEMLPESLLIRRPVSAANVDGTYREDFNEGGKNAKERRYPIMFLETNEFYWHVNTDLKPFTVEEAKKIVETNNRGKKTNALWGAYVLAAEDHDLEWFKNMLGEHEAAMRADAEEREQKAAEKAEKESKKQEKSKKKSEKPAAGDDVDMEDVEEGDTKKKSKKRKKEVDDVDGDDTTAKTPRTKIKLTNGPKTPATESAAKPKAAAKKGKKEKAVKAEEVEEAKVETPAEMHQRRSKAVLYLRHRLQKGFLSAKEPPKEEDMAAMDPHFTQLEEMGELDQDIIKGTKIHKVLKNIVRLETIPRDAEFNFTTRSNNLLSKWNKVLAAENGTPAAADAAEPATNGVSNSEKTEDAKPSIENGVTKEDEAEQPAKEEAATKSVEATDVVMADSKDEAPAPTGDEKEIAPAEEPATATVTA